MSVIIALLCWNVVPSPNRCSGPCLAIRELDQDVYSVLKSHKCAGQISNKTLSIQDLLLNRLTPHTLDPNRVNTLDICRYHLDWLTVKHPSFKQQRCSVLVEGERCNKPIDRRVTPTLSAHSYSSLSTHLPIGSGSSFLTI